MKPREQYTKETGGDATEEMHLPTFIKTSFTDEYVEWLEQKYTELVPENYLGAVLDNFWITDKK